MFYENVFCNFICSPVKTKGGLPKRSSFTGTLTIDIVGANIIDWRCFEGVDFSSPGFINLMRIELIKSIIDENNPASPCYIDPSLIGSCENAYYFVDIEDSGCMTLSHSFEDQASYLIPCGGGRCENNYRACYDYWSNPPKLIIEKVTSHPYQVYCPIGQLIPFDGTVEPTSGIIVPFDYNSSPCVYSCGE